VFFLSGGHVFERVKYSPQGRRFTKLQWLVQGTNHNFFNTVWSGTDDALQNPVTAIDSACGPASPDAVRLDPADQRRVGIALMASFIRYFEGGERRFGHQVAELVGNGKVEALRGRQVTGSSSRTLDPVPGSEFEVPADLVLIAIGFLHPDHEGPVNQLGLELDKRGNVRAPAFHTSRDGVWVAGDARVGQSLIVTAIAEGRRCARAVDRRLRSGETS